jgi:hypothetical protein
MATAEDFLKGPIPGQSLTTTPGNFPWEKPPEMVEVEDVVKFYVNKLANQDVMDDLSVIFDAGMAVSPFVKSLTTSGVMFGRHTLESGMLAGPAIHAFIKAAMSSYGIDVKDDPYDASKDPTEKEKKRLELRIKLAMAEAEEEGRTADSDPGVALLEELQSVAADEAPEMDAEQSEEVQPTEPTPQEGGMGLMSKEV